MIARETPAPEKRLGLWQIPAGAEGNVMLFTYFAVVKLNNDDGALFAVNTLAMIDKLTDAFAHHRAPAFPIPAQPFKLIDGQALANYLTALFKLDWFLLSSHKEPAEESDEQKALEAALTSARALLPPALERFIMTAADQHILQGPASKIIVN